MPAHPPSLSYLNGVFARIFVGLRVLCKSDVCGFKHPIAADRCLLRASTTDFLPCDISHATDSAVPRSLNQPTPELVGPLTSDSKLTSTLASYIRWFSLFKRGKSFLMPLYPPPVPVPRVCSPF